MEIETLVLGELQTNCYLLSDTHTRHCYVIDPADSGETISSTILERGWQLKGILLTHAHFDHVLGLLELSLNFPVPVWLHSDDNFLLKRANASAEHWLKRTADPVPTTTQPLCDGDVFQLGSFELKTWHLPGHTPGSCGFYCESAAFFMSGDTVFHNAVGRTDFQYSKPLLLHDSVHKISTLPADVKIYPGHGEPTTAAAVQTYLNSF